MNDLKRGAPVLVEISKDGVTRWEPAVFEKYEGTRMWVMVARTITRKWRRSFPSGKVRVP